MYAHVPPRRTLYVNGVEPFVVSTLRIRRELIHAG